MNYYSLKNLCFDIDRPACKSAQFVNRRGQEWDGALCELQSTSEDYMGENLTRILR